MKIADREVNRDLVLFLLGILIFLLPLVYIEPLHNPSALPRHVIAALIAGSSLIYISIMAWRYGFQLSYHVSQILVITYLLFACISWYWSIEHGNNLIEIVYLSAAIILFLIATQIDNLSHIRSLCFIAIIAGGIAALIGVMQHFGSNPFGLRNIVMASTFIYKNHAALYLDLIIPVAFFMLLDSKNAYRKYTIAISLGVCAGYIIESRTRGSLLSLAVIALIAIIFFSLHKPSRKLFLESIKQSLLAISVSAIVILTVVIPDGKNDANWQRNTIQSAISESPLIEKAKRKIDQSSMDRILFYRNSLEIIKNNPVLGTGYGTFWKAFREYMNTPYIIERSDETLYLFRLHNDILQVFTELGITGGALLLLIFAYIIFPGAKSLLKNTKSTDSSFFILAGLLLALLSSLTHAMVDFPFHKPSSQMQFWLWAGLTVALCAKKSGAPAIKPKSLLASGLAAASIFYFIFIFMFYSAYIKGNHYFYKAEQALKNKDCSNALLHIEESISSFSFYFIAHNARINTHILCNKNPQQLFNLLTLELKRDHSNTQALLKRAELLYANNYLTKAEEDYKTIIKLLPHRPAAKIGLANVYIKGKQIEKALRLLETSSKEHPDNKEIRSFLDKISKEKFD